MVKYSQIFQLMLSIVLFSLSATSNASPNPSATPSTIPVNMPALKPLYNSIALVLVKGSSYTFGDSPLAELIKNNKQVNTINVSDCTSLSDMKTYKLSRLAVEFFIHCEVIKTYNLANEILIIKAPNNARAIKLVENGQAVALSDTVFSASNSLAQSSKLLITDPILRKGEFNLGIFSAPNRADILATTDFSTLFNLTGVTVSHWPEDIKIFNQVTPNKLLKVSDHFNIPQLITKKRADITLQELSKKEIVNHKGDVMLVRIDGVKAEVKASREFLVHHKSLFYYEALQYFIRDNRAEPQNDHIHQAFKDIGLITDDYNHWTSITTLGAEQ